MLPASLCAKIMVFRRITRIIEVVLNERAVLFDLVNDPHELKNVVHEKKYRKKLQELRQAMISHLSERGEEFVKDGKLQILKRTVLYSPLFPDKNPVDTGI